MLPRLLAVVIDAPDPARVARFWAGVLGRVVLDDQDGLLLPGSQTQVGLRFVVDPAGRTGPDQLHLHLTSSGPTGLQDTVAAAIRLGARHHDVGQLPDEGHVVLADPAGNLLCVIEPDNAFLRGCGPLGEVACDGTRQVGLFWARALGWPLVWDQQEETAVQSPHGGTKVAWGGPPVPPRHGRSRQRFDVGLPDGDVETEADRLVALGASYLGSHGRVVELADPGGNEFCVRDGRPARLSGS